MGSIFRYEHKDCGFEYKHFDGVGFMGMELEQKAYEKIKERLKTMKGGVSNE